jgi:hypothetical protein
MLVQIEDKIISSEVFERKFVCDLSACKGACCIEGDAGAPLKKEEEMLLKKHLKDIIPFMKAESANALKTQGIAYNDIENDSVTSLVNGKECIFVHYDANQIAKCSIETAHLAGKIPNLKPISCHLYPIRIKQINEYTAINFDEWKICAPACVCGERLAIPVYRFLKVPLIRAFGEDFYKEMEVLAEELKALE